MYCGKVVYLLWYLGLGRKPVRGKLIRTKGNQSGIGTPTSFEDYFLVSLKGGHIIESELKTEVQAFIECI